MQVPEETATSVANKARARGARAHVVDGSAAASREATVEAIADTLSFPGNRPRSVAELYDRLADLSWLPAGEHVLIWVGSDALNQTDPKGYLSIRSVLADSQRAHGTRDPRRDGHTLTLAFADE